MTELTIRPEEIRDALDEFVRSYEPAAAARQEVGRVAIAGDGIARVEGLPSAMANELLEFEDGTLGIALNLDVTEIGVVVLGDYAGIEEASRSGGPARCSPSPWATLPRPGHRPARRTVGRFGRHPGRRATGTGAAGADRHPTPRRQRTAADRNQGDRCDDPDRRGQRQLILGDRQTGKTTIAVDTILNQRDAWKTGDKSKQVRCIYVATGQKGSTIASIRQLFDEAGALEYTTIVASPASDPAGFKYLSPYTGSALGQHWMYQGYHVLIVFDDLSKQAEAYRAVSLLLRRPPGARRTRVTSSTCTPACWNGAPSSPTSSAPAR